MTAQEKTAVQNKFAANLYVQSIAQYYVRTINSSNSSRKWIQSIISIAPGNGAIEAIDCTYINILASHVHEEAYVNHHGNHSLQAVIITSFIFYVY